MELNTIEFTNTFFPVREHSTKSLYILPMPPTYVSKNNVSTFLSADTIGTFLKTLTVSTNTENKQTFQQNQVPFSRHLDNLLCRTCSPYSDEHGGLCLIVKVRTVTRLALFCSNVQDTSSFEAIQFLVALISLRKTLYLTQTRNTITMDQLFTVSDRCLSSLQNDRWKNVINITFLRVHKMRHAREMVIGVPLHEGVYALSDKAICSNHLPRVSFTLTEESVETIGDTFKYRRKQNEMGDEIECLNTCLDVCAGTYFVSILDIEAALSLLWKQNVRTRYGESENKRFRRSGLSEWFRSVLYCRHYGSNKG